MEQLRRTPIQERAHATIEVLLEATAHILVEVGYARLSTNRVARRAGVSIGSLYQYFSDKDALVDALARRFIDRQIAIVLAQLERSEDVPLDTAIRSLIQGIVEAKRVEPELAAALASVTPRSGHLDHQRQTLRRLTEIVSVTLRRRPGLPPIDPEIAAFTLVHATFAVIQGALTERPELLAGDALVDSLCALCLGYLRPLA